MSLFYQPKYVFDTGPLIKMGDYPVDVFPTVWAKLNDLFIAQEAISCGEVLNELTNNVHGDDAISKWAKKNRHFFLAPEPNELRQVREILKKFPMLVSEDVFLSTKPQADPFVIALALVRDCVLVHGEKFKPNAPKIPNVCKHFDVKEMSLHDFFRAQGWVF
jgi:hypothetical protein